jgi:beta-1,4-N-acetylglucosaminyltransferase
VGARDGMKILLTSIHGGHVTEMLFLKEVFEGHDIVFLTYENPSTKSLPYKTYFINNFGANFLEMLIVFPKILKILQKENPDVIISTGSEIAIPVFLLGKLMRIKMVYIESWCRVNTKSGTGRIVYYLADVFLVQWPNLVKKYGKKARYEGAVI